jgi:hypothetical protein
MATAQANRAFVGFTVDGIKVEFLGKKTLYDGLKSVLGLDHVKETSEEGYLRVDKSTMFGNGGRILAIPLTVKGTVGNKQKTGKLVCPIDKVLTASEALIGKQYGGWKIQGAYISGDISRTY